MKRRNWDAKTKTKIVLEGLYNRSYLHSALDNMTPEEFVQKHQKTPEISNFRGTAFG